MLIDFQPEPLGPGIVTNRIQVELRSGKVGPVEVCRHDTLSEPGSASTVVPGDSFTHACGRLPGTSGSPVRKIASGRWWWYALKTNSFQMSGSLPYFSNS